MPTDIVQMPSSANDLGQEEQEELSVAEEYEPGELAPSIYTTEMVWKPDDIKKEDPTIIGLLTTLVNTVSTTDEAARRFSVLQCWQERHFDRGYQYLEGSQNGGWNVMGAGNGLTTARHNSLSDMDDANLYPTNIYSAQGDIITSCLNRGAVTVNFSPNRQKEPADVMAADEANKYKCMWYEENCAGEFQRYLSDLAWTDPRAVVWTRTVADKSRFGLADDGSVRRAEMSSAFGVLETKLPMMADCLKDMGYAQLFEEMDYSIARAMYPWMGKKIKPSWGTFGELEFERIARINTRIGIVGKYITGTSGIRECTMGYNWFRPGIFYDDAVTPAQREWLLKNFPDGMFLIMAGPEVVACWNESMDDHLTMGMFCRGFGQNRRALGSNDLPIQKRINIWADLWDKFVRQAIPATLLDSDCFNMEAINELNADPGRKIGVKPGEGQTMQDIVGQTPSPTPIPGMDSMFLQYVGPLIQAIDGGTPALFGQGEGSDNTVGATQIRLGQALERNQRPWQVINSIFEGVLLQAVGCFANNGQDTEYSSDDGDFVLSPKNLGGNVKCKAETSNSIPESGSAREAKVLQILDMAQLNPTIAGEVGKPSNAKAIVDALHMDGVITIDEANWEDAALEDIDRLLDSEPIINPEWVEMKSHYEKMNAMHEEAKQVASAAAQTGKIGQEQIQAGQEMQDQVNDLKDQFDKMDKYFPSVEVAQDDSQDHDTIAATVLSWMGEPHGRSLRRKSGQEQEGGENWKKWTNVYLYWQQNKKVAAQFKQAQAAPPKVSLTGKLSPEQQAQLLQLAAGISTPPDSMNQPNETEVESIQRTPMAEIKTRTRRRL
jgi:hypothetical protein